MPSTRGVVVKNDPILAEQVNKEILPSLQALFNENKVNDAIDLVHEYERKLRLTEDYKTLSALFSEFVKNIFKIKKPFTILEELTYFMKKKHSLRPALECLVSVISDEYKKYYQNLDNNKEYEEFLSKFVEISEGKLYAEKPRSQAIALLSGIAETRNELKKAKDLLLMTHVETMASLDYENKTKFLLEQMRLCLKCHDYIKLELISKKINKKFINQPENEEYLITFFDYMTHSSFFNSKFTQCVDYFSKLLKCQSVRSNIERKIPIVKLLISTVIISTYCPENVKLLQEIEKDEDISSLSTYLQLIKIYTSDEILQISKFDEKFRQQIFLNENEPLLQMLKSLDFYDLKSSQSCNERMSKIMSELDLQLRHRNIHIFSKYFTSMRLQRIAELLECSNDEAEDLLVDMIVDDRIDALINRLGDISVAFTPYNRANNSNNASLIDDYSRQLSHILQQIETTNYMISNEEMIDVIN